MTAQLRQVLEKSKIEMRCCHNVVPAHLQSSLSDVQGTLQAEMERTSILCFGCCMPCKVL